MVHSRCRIHQLNKAGSFSDKSNDTTKDISVIRRSLPQIIAVSVKNVLLLAFGMTLGYPTILIPSLSGGNPEENIVLGQEELSWIGSVNYLCVPLGCLLSGVFTQPLGRRRAMQIVNLPFLAAWLLFHFATESWHVFLALSMTGFTGGLMEAPVLTYVAEITEPHIRGALSSTSTMSINLGILTSFLLGTFLKWRTMALINLCIPFIALILLMFVPESPYWLISRNRLDEAKSSLAWLRGWTTVNHVEEEYLRLRDNLEKNPMKKKGDGKLLDMKTVKLYFKPEFLRPYSLITLIFVIGHFGNTPINIYAIKIFNLLQAPVGSYYATVTIGIVQLLAIIICVFSIKYFGKRLLVWISLIGMITCFLVAGIYSYKIGANRFSDINSNTFQGSINWIPLVALVAQAFFSYLCIKALPWIMIGELYNNDVRAFASGFSAASGYVFGFLANKTFLNFVEGATFPGVLWFYTSVACVGLVVLYFLLPETEGKSLEQISDHYSGGKKLDNTVYRTRKVRGKINKGFDSGETIVVESLNHGH